MLADRRIVITGVGGIGEQVAHAVSRAGGRVHLVDVDESRCREIASELNTSYTRADLRHADAVDHAFTEARSELGRMDGLVAIAGGSGRRFGDGPVHTMTESAIEQTIAANVTPAALALGAFVRHRDTTVPGAGILISSVLARHPHPLFGTHAYAAAKAAIEGLAIAAAGYYATEGLSINVVAPGLTRTPMSRRAQADEAIRDFARARQPLSDDGFIVPDQVAGVCCALLASPSVTGQVVDVDGGWSVL